MESVVLGFSGLDQSRSYKRQNLPDLADFEYDIFQGADAAAALLVGDKVIAAAAEERFDGIKHSERFPLHAALACLQTAGLTVHDIDVVSHSFSYGSDEAFYADSGYYASLFENVFRPEVCRAAAEDALGVDLQGRFVPVRHHLAHAASAFVPSGFSESLVLVTDGLGERNSATVYTADQNGYEPVLEIGANCSIGLLYGLFTMYLGFRFGDGEYKVMGLAPYGNPGPCRARMAEHCLRLEADGRYSVPVLLENVTALDKETYRPSLLKLEELFGPRRAPDDPMEQRHLDVAAALQAAVQEAQMHLLQHCQQVTDATNLAIAGGVGLNCVANGVILRSRLFDRIYVQPAAGDDGAALGAALIAATELGVKPLRHISPLLGQLYSAADCEAAVASGEFDVDRLSNEESLVDTVAAMIDDGMIIGWHQGEMEFGPRALGNRSILADPRREDMRDRINALVKKRESFRPFAPAVTQEAASTLFEIAPEDVDSFSDMLFVAYVRPEVSAKLPSTTHVDGSARVQTVSQASNARFWKLITAFGKRTGVPVLLNTSFNVKGQPIVRTPQEAVETFLDAGLDALVLGDLILRRRDGGSNSVG